MTYSAWEAANYQGRFPRWFGWSIAVLGSILCYALVAALVFWAFMRPLPAQGSELRIIHCYGACSNGLHPAIQHPLPPATEIERQEAEERARKWEAYCHPVPVWNGLAYKMQYDHEGCDLGRMSD